MALQRMQKVFREWKAAGQANNNTLMINLIDLCLTPTLAVFQLSSSVGRR
jgi:hypothetical protein